MHMNILMRVNVSIYVYVSTWMWVYPHLYGRSLRGQWLLSVQIPDTGHILQPLHFGKNLRVCTLLETFNINLTCIAGMGCSRGPCLPEGPRINHKWERLEERLQPCSQDHWGFKPSRENPHPLAQCLWDASRAQSASSHRKWFPWEDGCPKERGRL